MDFALQFAFRSTVLSGIPHLDFIGFGQILLTIKPKLI